MIKLYNTLNAEKEEFIPLNANKVSIYVCGVTVYDLCHIGHGRSSVAFDLIRRVLIDNGYNVTFVKNFTDVDDKIIKRANEKNIPWDTLATTFIDEHNKDMDSLFIMRPDNTPKATEYIPQMIRFCEKLIEKGSAYTVNGDVYFRVKSFDDYGKLSHRNVDDLLSGARVDINEAKENPLDFALWKSAKAGEPSWQSPFGNGRPGWHIECSVMSEELLGETIDIHGGGQDLIFPHHENEIAQSESLSCKVFAKYWVHNGFVNINKEKMSKSLNNFFTIRDILTQCNPETLRFFFLTTHYRGPLEYSPDKLTESKTALDRIYIFLDELSYANGAKSGKDLTTDVDIFLTEFLTEFDSSLRDDFNSPKAVATIFETVRKGNTILASKPSIETVEQLKKAVIKFIDKINKVLGLLNYTPHDWFKLNLTIPIDELEKLITERTNAKANKDYIKADEIRKSLSDKGIELIDTVAGTRFRA